jgi:phenylpropionate dioxygenase-like ring-hydroxylating dioxygenase large terminal subunit
MSFMARDEIASLVKPDRVHRRLYTDPDIFELEMDRIFGQAWIYVGHESMAKKPGDWFQARMGREPIVVTRDAAGKLHAMVNRCPHRGARVCTGERGNAPHLTCPYHAWTFHLDGSLDAVPRVKGYPENFDPNALGMPKVARFDSYRGFLFASLTPRGPTLEDYLGPLKDAFDNMIDRSPDGQLEATGGVCKQEFAGNWKMHMENAVDLVHPGVVHESSVAAARSHSDSAGPGREGQPLQMFRSNGLSLAEWENVNLVGSPRGHVYMGAFYNSGSIAPERTDPLFLGYRAKLVARHGEEKTKAILARKTFNNLVYPNVSINPLFQTLRFIQPIAVDKTVVYSSCFRLVGAPDEFFRQTVTFLATTNSPSSLISTDDLEIFERCQASLPSRTNEWLNLQRNVHTDRLDNDGTVQANGTSEMPIRVQMRAWLDHMTGEPA